jgi:hypothetical protein
MMAQPPTTYTSYPQGTDLGAMITSAGLTAPPGVVLDSFTDAAAAEWEDETAWHPYLAAPNPQTLRFDPPGVPTASGRLASWRGGRHLDLHIGLIICNWVNIGVVDDYDAVANEPLTTPTLNSGTTLQQNLQYFLRPDNAAFQNMPHDEIEFATRQSGIPKSIAVNGIWGRERQLAANVWNAILGYAFFLVRPQLSIAISGGLQSVTDEKTTVVFARGPDTSLGAESDQLKQTFFTLARKKMRI